MPLLRKQSQGGGNFTPTSAARRSAPVAATASLGVECPPMRGHGSESRGYSSLSRFPFGPDTRSRTRCRVPSGGARLTSLLGNGNVLPCLAPRVGRVGLLRAFSGYSAVLHLLAPFNFQAPVRASIQGDNQLSVDFTKQEDAAARAGHRGRPDVLESRQGRFGLRRSARDVDRLEAGFRPPFCPSASPRGPARVGERARHDLACSTKPITLKSVAAFTPFGGNLYARFSPDLKHWSSWQELTSTPPLPRIRRAACLPAFWAYRIGSGRSTST